MDATTDFGDGTEATGGLTNTIQEVDGVEIQVRETDDPRLYEVINLSQANREASEEGVEMDVALRRHTYTTLVSHQRELVLETDDPESRNRLQNPLEEHEDETTGSIYDVAVGRYLGYEVLSYDIDQQDVKNLQLIRDACGGLGWMEAAFLKRATEEFGGIASAARRLGLDSLVA